MKLEEKIEKANNKIILPKNVASCLEKEDTFSQGALFGIKDGNGLTTLIYPLFMPLDFTLGGFQTFIPLAENYQKGVQKYFTKQLNNSNFQEEVTPNSQLDIAILPFLIYKKEVIGNAKEVTGTSLPLQIKVVTKGKISSVLYVIKSYYSEIFIANAKITENGFNKIDSHLISIGDAIPESSVTAMSFAVSSYETEIHDPKKNPKYTQMFLCQN